MTAAVSSRRSRRRHSGVSVQLSANPVPSTPGSAPTVVSPVMPLSHGSRASPAAVSSPAVSSAPAAWLASSTVRVRVTPIRRSAGTRISSPSTVTAR